MTGRAITGPCDVPNKTNGPLSDECILSLYSDPSTYSPLKVSDYASSSTTGTTMYCTKDGLLNPATPAGMARAKAAGGVEAVRTLYKTAHQNANDNSFSNIKRREDIRDCYGIDVQHQNPEVFLVMPQTMTPTNGYTLAQGGDVCRKLGNAYEVATKDQLKMAALDGAKWPQCGWTQDVNDTLTYDGKGCNNQKGGIYCYGNKPASRQIPSDITIAKFNDSNWANPASD
jgi:hypothetical protein